MMPPAAERLKPRLWLFAIAVCLTAWQFVLIGRITADSNRQVVDLMFWLAVLMLLWQKRHRLNLESDRLSTGAGILLLGFVFYKCLGLYWFESLPLRMVPVLAPLGLALLASGWRGLRQYWREFIILGLLLIPFDRFDRFLEYKTPFNEITAAFSSFLLHYVGFDIVRNGAILELAGDRNVYVAYECTGGQIILLLTKLSLLFVLVFPLTARWRILMLGLPTVLGFLIGGIRVGLLTIVVNNPEQFHFWHGDAGNQIFSTVSMVLYGIWCYHVHENVVIPLEDRLALAEGKRDVTVDSADREEVAPDSEPEPALEFALAPHDRELKRPLVLVVWGAIALLTAYTLVVPSAGGRSLDPLALPEQIELPGAWQQTASEPLPTNEELTEQRFERIRAARSYTYHHPEATATVELRHVTGSLGDLDTLLYNRKIDAGSPQTYQTRELAGVGRYRLFVFKDRVYLTGLLNPRGESVTNAGEFLAIRKEYDPLTNRLGPWLLGQTSLRDRQCLWALISVPAPAGDPAAAYATLEGLWQVGYPQWQAKISRSSV